jgi:hypothetical protein
MLFLTCGKAKGNEKETVLVCNLGFVIFGIILPELIKKFIFVDVGSEAPTEMVTKSPMSYRGENPSLNRPIIKTFCSLSVSCWFLAWLTLQP